MRPDADCPWHPVVVLRADGGDVGLGHVMRCVALAEAWTARRGRAVLIAPKLPGWIENRLADHEIDVVESSAQRASNEDLHQIISTVNETQANVVVLDGYCFDEQYQSGLVQSDLVKTRCCVAVIDDHGSIGSYKSKVVIDQNLGAKTSFYQHRPKYSKLLLGPQYALIRSEFTRATLPKNQTQRPMHLLLALGGSPDRHSKRRMDEVENLLGNKFEIKQSSGTKTVDMAKVMRWADIAVAASGSISWELCAMQVPFLAFSIADNQRRVRNELGSHGIAVDLGDLKELTAQQIADEVLLLAGDPTRRNMMANAGGNLVDGNGPNRVVTALRAAMIELQIATFEHELLLFEWANDAAVRQWAFSKEPISWNNHRSWFADKLKDQRCKIYIALLDGHEIGQVRFDSDDDAASVDVTMSPVWRGSGMGAAMIQAAAERAVVDQDIKEITAEIFSANITSIKSFEGAGFRFITQYDDPAGKVHRYRYLPEVS